MRNSELSRQQVEKFMRPEKKNQRAVEKKMEKLMQKTGKKSHYIFSYKVSRIFFNADFFLVSSPASSRLGASRPLSVDYYFF